ncbi:YfzA family protein [Gracilibacillus pellucidus]|uniref:YfzA family protein n=1 Tax=Gracilibacillus pellucidus TaxID=3095368 RepID=UPI0039B6EA9E
MPLGLFLILNSILFLFDHSSWTLYFQEGGYIEKLSNSQFFSEWFTPYRTPVHNVLVIFFMIICLPETVINFIEYLKAKRTVSS